MRGGSRSSRTRGGMRWTRQRQARKVFAGRLSVSEHGAQDDDVAAYGKTVWSWHPWLMSSCRWRIRSNRIDPPSSPAGMEAKGIRLQGERGISRQTIAQGMPACSGCTCMLVCASLYNIAHETAGAASTRHSLLPHFGGKRISANLGRVASREREDMSDAKRRHCERSEAIHSFVMPQRGLLRSARNDVDRPQRTGSPACAGYDSVVCGATA
jgi:hypothetical protein